MTVIIHHPFPKPTICPATVRGVSTGAGASAGPKTCGPQRQVRWNNSG